MRSLMFLLFFFVGNAVADSCDNHMASADYKNRYIAITSDCEPGRRILFMPIENGGPIYKKKSELVFSKECRFIKAEDESFVCRINPKSPLSGATYKTVQIGNRACGEEFGEWPDFVFRCVKGCKDVPKDLHQPAGCC